MRKADKKLSVRSYEISLSLCVDIRPVLIINTNYAKISNNSYRIKEQKDLGRFLKRAQNAVPSKSKDLNAILSVLNACNECKGVLFTVQPFLETNSKDVYLFRFAFGSAEALKRFDDLILSVE